MIRKKERRNRQATAWNRWLTVFVLSLDGSAHSAIRFGHDIQMRQENSDSRNPRSERNWEVHMLYKSPAAVPRVEIPSCTVVAFWCEKCPALDKRFLISVTHNYTHNTRLDSDTDKEEMLPVASASSSMFLRLVVSVDYGNSRKEFNKQKDAFVLLDDEGQRKLLLPCWGTR